MVFLSCKVDATILKTPAVLGPILLEKRKLADRPTQEMLSLIPRPKSSKPRKRPFKRKLTRKRRRPTKKSRKSKKRPRLRKKKLLKRPRRKPRKLKLKRKKQRMLLLKLQPSD